jgi:hypothetical protein
MRRSEGQHTLTRQTLCDPVSYAIEGASKLPSEQAERIIVSNARAFTALRIGAATRDDFDKLTQAALMADDLRRFKLAREHKATFAAAIDALTAILTRSISLTAHGSTPRYVATGPELNAIELALLVHSVQVRAVSVREMESSVRKLHGQWLQQRRTSRQPA